MHLLFCFKYLTSCPNTGTQGVFVISFSFHSSFDLISCNSFYCLFTKMKFLTKSDSIDLLEKDVRNKWRWEWMEESYDGKTVREWCRKIDTAGACFCASCGKTISYGSSGKKALWKHAQDNVHKRHLNSLKVNCKLPYAQESLPGVTQHSVTDRVQEVKGRLGLFIAEHCLPYSISGPLLALTKTLAQDVTALNATKMERGACTYTMTHGIGKTFKEDLAMKLKNSFFSINIDEATNNAHDKVQNVLCQYFDEDIGEFVVELLGSRVVNLATSSSLFSALDSLFCEMGLKWDQVISAMMDNCSVMRGSKGGVEVKIREHNNYLLDISGDTVHMVSNTAKAFFDVMEGFFPVQPLASSIYYDIQDSPKMKELFCQILNLLHLKERSLLRPISTRFLQMYEVSSRLLELWDAIWLFYFGHLTSEDKKKHQQHLGTLMSRYKLGKDEQATILVPLWKNIKQKTPAGARRVENILNFLFDKPTRTLFHLKLYKGILETFKSYVLKFQSEKPSVHTLHTEMFGIVKDFYSLFLKPDAIPLFSAPSLSALDFTSAGIHLPERDLSVGKYAFYDLLIMKKDKLTNPWLPEFYSTLKAAYVAGAKKLKSLPLTNTTLLRLATLDPGLQRSTGTARSILNLAESLPQVIPPENLGALDLELRMYCTDNALSQLNVEPQDSSFRIDRDWWCYVFSAVDAGCPKYPVLSKLVKALLSCFSGPLVEGSFNLMDDILEGDRSTMTSENFEALLRVKYHLKSSRHSSINYPISSVMRRNIFCASAARNRAKTSEVPFTSAPSAIPSSSTSLPIQSSTIPSSSKSSSMQSSAPSSSKSSPTQSSNPSATPPSIQSSAPSAIPSSSKSSSTQSSAHSAIPSSSKSSSMQSSAPSVVQSSSTASKQSSGASNSIITNPQSSLKRKAATQTQSIAKFFKKT